MSLSKGINSHIAYGGEVTHGTAGALDLFARIVSETLRHQKDPFMSESLEADWNQDVFFSAGRNEGSVVFETIYTGLELFWHSLFGTYVITPGSPEVGANTHVFAFNPTTNVFPKGITIEAVRGIGGALERSFLGMHVTKATLEFSPRQVMRATFDFLGTGQEKNTPTAATFPGYLPVLPAHKSVLTLGGDALTILSGSLEIEVPRAGDREHYGEPLYKEAVVQGRPVATFSLQCEHNDATGEDTEEFVQNYLDETEIDGLVITHSGDIVALATPYSLAISGSKAVITAAHPSAQNPEINQITIDGTITKGLLMTLINGTGTAVT
jgi:hypothetical protein